jgi:hypothetical protein
MLSCVKVLGVELSDFMITMMYVLPVNRSMKAEKSELRTSIPWNCDCVLLQLSLNWEIGR